MASPFTVTKQAVSRALTLARSQGTSLTASELAEIAELTPDQVYRALKALERAGLAEQLGVSFNGGRTWRLTETKGAVL